jgi:hypothetical protein
VIKILWHDLDIVERGDSAFHATYRLLISCAGCSFGGGQLKVGATGVDGKNSVDYDLSFFGVMRYTQNSAAVHPMGREKAY